MIGYDPNYRNILSQSLASSGAAEQKLINELSSGLRVSKLSDDPLAASQNVLLTSSLSRIDAFVTNAGTDQSLLQVSDSSLGEVVSQVTSAIGLAVSAGNGTLNSSDLGAIGKQISQIRDTVLSLANTSYLGSYVFGGSAGNTKPFTLDNSTDPATVSYNGDQVTRSLVTPDGQSLSLNVPGNSVFTADGKDLLGTLNRLVSDLGAGNTAAVQSDGTALSAALGAVSVQRSAIDSSLSRLNTTTGYANSQQALFTAQQSSLLAANTAQVATGLQAAEIQNQALLGVASSYGKTNLFDYLK